MLFQGLAQEPPAVRPCRTAQCAVRGSKNLLKSELKRKGVTYAQLAEKLAEVGVHETERNLNNKISRGGFTAAFLLQCLEAIGASTLQLS